jgi:hypothetical protein
MLFTGDSYGGRKRAVFKNLKISDLKKNTNPRNLFETCSRRYTVNTPKHQKIIGIRNLLLILK